MSIVMIRGGGDLASGVGLRLFRSGLQVVVVELSQPLVVRRMVSFAEAIYAGEIWVEGAPGCLARDVKHARQILSKGQIPILVDPAAETRRQLQPLVLVDGRMTKRPPELDRTAAPLVIGLGPGFRAGENCHAAIETNRGHSMGRVLWEGAPEADTGIPESVADRAAERVLRAPDDGVLTSQAVIGDIFEPGQPVAEVAGQVVTAPFHGVLRGLIHPGFRVTKGMKIGDLDPRGDPRACFLVSDKSLAVGGGVLEAVLSRPEIRSRLWQ